MNNVLTHTHTHTHTHPVISVQCTRSCNIQTDAGQNLMIM